jgi:hypothetical protein
MPSQIDYREVLREKREVREGTPLCFSSVADNISALEIAFNAAEKSIRILTPKLDSSIYASHEVLMSGQAFLAYKDHSLEILVEDPNNEWHRHPFISHLKTFMEGDQPRLHLRIVPPNYSESLIFGLLLLDDYGFHYYRDKHRTEAICAYNPPNLENKSFENLADNFDQLWSVSSPYLPDVAGVEARAESQPRL